MIFSHVFDLLEHDARPLLSAAAKWAEAEGRAIVKEVRAEVAAKGPAELAMLFNATLGAKLGIALPLSGSLSDEAKALLTTALARAKAAAVSGSSLRASILNAGIEQAVLLEKAAAHDSAVAPPTPKAA